MPPKMTRRADGRYVKKITDPRTGKPVYFYGKTVREINEKLMEYQGKTAKGRTFREVADEWWKNVEPDLASQTVKVYRPALKRALEEFGDMYVKDIRPKHISSYLRLLVRRDEMAMKTLMNHRTVLNQIMKHAVVEYDIETNPCHDVQTPKNLSKTKRSAATTEEEQKIRKAADDWLFPVICLYTGMRKGEILALQWKDIDFEQNLIHVTKSISHTNNRPEVKSPKTEAGKRIVPLLDDLKSVLLNRTPQIPEHYIISDDGITPLSNTRYAALYKQFQQRTGVKSTAHQLRHSFATIAFECGVPEKSLQEILGHRQLSTTLDLYAEFRRQSLLSAAEKLNQKR